MWAQPQQVDLLGGQAWLWLSFTSRTQRCVFWAKVGAWHRISCSLSCCAHWPGTFWSFTANALQGLLLPALGGKANISSQILPKGSPQSYSLGALSSLLALLWLVCFADGPCLALLATVPLLALCSLGSWRGGGGRTLAFPLQLCPLASASPLPSALWGKAFCSEGWKSQKGLACSVWGQGRCIRLSGCPLHSSGHQSCLSPLQLRAFKMIIF